MDFKVDATADTATKTTVDVRGHKLVLDEGPEMGGDDDGPNPVEYQLAALTGCLNVIGHMVADEKDIELNSLDISVEGSIENEGFQSAENGVKAGLKDVKVSVDADSEAPDDELADWLAKTEKRCPVSDTMQDATNVSVELK